MPLYHDAEHGFLLVINALLDANVDLNYANEDGNTALHIAIIFERKEIIEMLINHNSINLRLQNNDDLTPFSTRPSSTKSMFYFFLYYLLDFFFLQKLDANPSIFQDGHDGFVVALSIRS